MLGALHVSALSPEPPRRPGPLAQAGAIASRGHKAAAAWPASRPPPGRGGKRPGRSSLQRSSDILFRNGSAPQNLSPTSPRPDLGPTATPHREDGRFRRVRFYSFPNQVFFGKKGVGCCKGSDQELPPSLPSALRDPLAPSPSHTRGTSRLPGQATRVPSSSTQARGLRQAPCDPTTCKPPDICSKRLGISDGVAMGRPQRQPPLRTRRGAEHAARPGGRLPLRPLPSRLGFLVIPLTSRPEGSCPPPDIMASPSGQPRVSSCRSADSSGCLVPAGRWRLLVLPASQALSRSDTQCPFLMSAHLRRRAPSGPP